MGVNKKAEKKKKKDEEEEEDKNNVKAYKRIIYQCPCAVPP